MAKTQANYPASKDVLDTDRIAGQDITSDSYDIIEDAITEMQAEMRRVTSKTTTATLTSSEGGLVLVSAAGAYTITLPTAVGNLGLTYRFLKTDYNYNLTTIDANGAQTINYECSAGTPQLTYPRLNTPLAEVTMTSDNANWQVTNEKLGQVPECEVYQTTAQTTYNGFFCKINYDTESYDIGDGFTNATWITGSATATTTNHLIDTTNSPFTANMVNMRIKNTTDTTYCTISAVNSTSDVTVTPNIFASGEGYEIKKSQFVAPISGKYFMRAITTWDSTNMVDQKLLLIYAVKNTTNVGLARTVSSGTSIQGVQTIIILDLAKDDEMFVKAYQTAAAVDLYTAGSPLIFNNFQIRLLSKD